MTPTQPNETMLSAVSRAVADACSVCKAVQKDIDTVRSLTKDDRSPVTVADFASQAVIAHQLHQLDSSLELVAEETAGALQESPEMLKLVVNAARRVWAGANDDAVLEAIDLGGATGGSGSFWTLDPIDGTKGFLRGQQYAVSLAKIENGAPVLGLLGCPNLSADLSRPFDQPDPTGTIYIAEKDAGLSQVSAADPTEPPMPIERPSYDSSAALRLCESVEKAHSSHDATSRILDSLGRGRDSQRLDSQCKYAVVARGQADAYLRMPKKAGYIERIWDHGAGAIVATEAGATVTDIRGKALNFSLGRGLEQNLGIVCAPPPLHAELIDIIAKLGLDTPPAEG